MIQDPWPYQLYKLGLNLEKIQRPPQDFCNIQTICCMDSTFFSQPQDPDLFLFASSLHWGEWLGQRWEEGGRGVMRRNHLAVCRIFHHLANCTSSFLLTHPSGITDLQLGSLFGLVVSGSSSKQYYQSDFSTKVVSIQVHIWAANGIMFSFSSSVSPKYGMKRILNGTWMKIIHQYW